MLLLYYYIHTYICIGTRHFAHRVFQYMDKRVSAAENGDDDVVRSFAFRLMVARRKSQRMGKILYT